MPRTTRTIQLLALLLASLTLASGCVAVGRVAYKPTPESSIEIEVIH